MAVSDARELLQPGHEVAAKSYDICMLYPGHVLTDHLPFGDGLVAFGFISELARRGHRLHVIAQRIHLQNPLPPNVTIHPIVARERGIVQRLRFLFGSRAIVRRLLAAGQIDLVQQLNPVSNGMSFGMIGLRVPIVLGTFVGNWPAEPAGKPSLAGKVFGTLVRAARFGMARLQEDLASAFLVTTPAALDRFSSARHVAPKIAWIPHGIDVRMFEQRPPRAGVQSILFLAGVTKKKGVFTLLDAFERVHTVLPDVRLDIVGGGAQFEEVERRIATMPSGSHIRILGLVDRARVPAVMADASVYCLPSFGEPYAATAIEAMACGKPLVVTDSGGLRYMVSDAGGRRVRPGDGEELASALVEILSSPTLQQKMGAHNRQLAEREYDWPRVSEKLEAVYARVLAGTAATA